MLRSKAHAFLVERCSKATFSFQQTNWLGRIFTCILFVVVAFSQKFPRWILFKCNQIIMCKFMFDDFCQIYSLNMAISSVKLSHESRKLLSLSLVQCIDNYSAGNCPTFRVNAKTLTANMKSEHCRQWRNNQYLNSMYTPEAFLCNLQLINTFRPFVMKSNYQSRLTEKCSIWNSEFI